MTDVQLKAVSAQCVDPVVDDVSDSFPASFNAEFLVEDSVDYWGTLTEAGRSQFERRVVMGDERFPDFPESATMTQLMNSQFIFPDLSVSCFSQEDCLELLRPLVGMRRTIMIGAMLRLQFHSKWAFTIDELKYHRASCRDDNSRQSTVVKQTVKPAKGLSTSRAERRVQKRFTPLLIHASHARLTNRTTRNGKESEFIRFPYHKDWAPIELAPPGRLSLGTYQRILNTRAGRLMESVTPTNRKVVLCNAAAASLMKMRVVVVSDAALYDHFRRSSVYLHDLDHPSAKLAPPRLMSDQFPRPSVFIRGTCVTPENVELFAPLFSRNKPYYRALVDYVCGAGDSSILPIVRKVVAEHDRAEKAKLLTFEGMATTLSRLDYMIAKKKWTNQALNDRIRAYLLAPSPDGVPGDSYSKILLEMMIHYTSPLVSCPLQLQGPAEDIGDTAFAVIQALKEGLQARVGFGTLSLLVNYLRDSGAFTLASCLSKLVLLYNAPSLEYAVVLMTDWLITRIDLVGLQAESSDEESKFGNTPVTDLLVNEGYISLLKKLIQEIFSTVASTFWGQLDVIKSFDVSEFADLTVRQIKRQQAVSVATWISGLIQDLLTRVKLCFTAGSLMPLFDMTSDYQNWRGEAAAITSYHCELLRGDTPVVDHKRLQQLRDAGFIPKHWNEPFTVHEFFAKIDQLYIAGEYHVAHLPTPNMVVEAKQLLGRLKAFQEQFSMLHVGSHQRKQPFAIYICGASSVGKSNLLNDIFQGVGRVQGYDISDVSRYDIQDNVNFQSLMGPQWFMAFDDKDQNVGQATLGMDNFCTMVIKLVNNAPYAVEEADVSRKGTNFAAPLLVPFTSNYIDFADEHYIRDKIAFRRRFIHKIQPVPMPAFCKRNPFRCDADRSTPEGEATYQQAYKDYYETECRPGETVEARDVRCQIPPIKTRMLDPSLVYDGCTEHVYIIVKKWDSVTQQHEHVADMSLPEYLKYLNTEFRAHIEIQTRLLNRFSNKPWCPDCGANLVGDRPCLCTKKFRLQGYPGSDRVDMLYGLIGSVTALAAGIQAYSIYKSTRLMEETAQDAYPVLNTAQRTLTTVSAAAVDLSTFIARLPKFEPFSLSSFGELALSTPNKRNVALLTMLLAAFGYAYTYFKSWRPQGEMVPVPVEASGNVNLPKPNAWTRVKQSFEPTPLVSTISVQPRETLVRDLRRNMLMFESQGGLHMRGVIVSTNLVVCNRHCLERILKHGPIVQYAYLHTPESKREITITQSSTSLEDGSDLAVLLVPGVVCSGVMKHQTLLRPPVSTFDDAQIVYPLDSGRGTVPFRPRLVSYPGYGLTMISEGPVDTHDGDCGLPYIVRVRDHWYFAGIHYATSNGIVDNGCCMGMVITQEELGVRSKQLATLYVDAAVPEAIFQCGGKDVPTSLVEYPPKSEVWAAHSMHGAFVVPRGSLISPVSGSSMHSTVEQSRASRVFQEKYAIAWTGKFVNFCKPEFSGEMIGDRWVSPYSNALVSLRDSVAPREFLFLALADYLSALRHLPPNVRVSPLTNHEVIAGIHGTSIDAMNRLTSMGFPFCTKKKFYMEMNIDGSFVVDDEFLAHVDAYLQLLLQGVAPIPVTLDTLKDEPISVEKNASHDVRIFNIVPASFNWLAKRFLTPLEHVMRGRYDIFESYVGIDIASREGHELVERLISMSPDRGLDVDMKKQDKSMCGDMVQMIALAVYAIAVQVGLPAEVCYLLIEGARNALHIAKGRDVYQTGATNISGAQFTLLQAGLDNSLGQRYIYYRMKYPGGLPPELSQQLYMWQLKFLENPVVPESLLSQLTFREHVKLATFGDDAISSVSPACTFYNPELIPLLGSELGKVYTDGQKQDRFLFRPVTSLMFLKRSFVWSDEFGMYICPLSKKSLLKTLTLRMKSSLTDLDQESEMMVSTLREMMLYGREAFEDLLETCNEVAEKFGHKHSTYYRPKSYDELAARFVAKNTLTVFDPPAEVAQWEGSITLQYDASSTNMSVDQSSAVSGNDLTSTSSAPNEEVSGISVLHAAATVASGGTSFAPAPFPKFPVNDLGEFMLRRTKVQQYTLASTNTYGQTIFGAVDPHFTFLGDAFIAPRIAAFRYCRGNFRLTGTLSTAPGCYGMYAVVAHPRSNNYIADGTSFAPAFNNYPQLPHVEINIAESTNFELELPWIHPYYTGQVAGNGGKYPVHSQWDIFIWCLRPITSALGATTPNATLTMYGHFLPGYELSVPILQGFGDTAKAVHSKAKNKAVSLLGAAPSAVASSVSQTAASLSAVPVIGPLAGTVAAGAAAASSVLGMFGFTRETAEVEPTPVVPRPWSNIANVDGKDTSEIAALSVTNSTSIDPNLYGIGSVDQASFEFLEKHWTVMGKVSWATTNASGTQLKLVAVTPFLGENSMGSGVGWMPTVGGFLAMPFSQWRCDMEYRLVIPASSFHRGTLQISWQPDLSNSAVVDVTNSRYNMIIDIEEGSEYIFTIPYLQNRPMEQRIPKTFNNTIATTIGANGFFRIDVVNPLRVQTDTASLDIFVYARTKGIQFAQPSQFFPHLVSDGSITWNDIQHNVRLQSEADIEPGAVGSAGPKPPIVIDLIPANTCLDIRPTYAGEKFESVRALIQKMSYVPLAFLPGSGVDGPRRVILNHFPHAPYENNAPAWILGFNHPTGSTSTTIFTYYGYYLSMYHGVAGSTRYKIMNTTRRTNSGSVIDSQKVFGVAPCSFDYVETGITGNNYGTGNRSASKGISTIDPCWPCPAGEAVEVTVPYYGSLDYCTQFRYPLMSLYTGADGNVRADQIEISEMNTSVTTETSIALYVGAGPDTRFHMFRGIRYFKANAPFINPGITYGTALTPPALVAAQETPGAGSSAPGAPLSDAGELPTAFVDGARAEIDKEISLYESLADAAASVGHQI